MKFEYFSFKTMVLFIAPVVIGGTIFKQRDILGSIPIGGNIDESLDMPPVSFENFSNLHR